MSDLKAIHGKNLCGATVLETAHYQECNVAQRTPGTEITVSGSIFEGCNLVNCTIPLDNEIIDCNAAQINYDELEEPI